MKKKILLNRSLSLLLSICMVFSLAVMIPAAALADDGTDAGDDAAPGSANVDGNYAYAIVADRASGDQNPSPLPDLYGVDGLYVGAQDGRKAVVSTDGLVVADHQGLKAVAQGPGSEVVVQVKTDVTSGTDDAVSISAQNGGKVTVGAKTVTAKENSDGIDITAELGADVNVTAEAVFGDKDGITVSSRTGSVVKVNPQKLVNAREDGVVVNADDFGSVAVIGGTDTTNIRAGNTGLEIQAKNNAQAGGIVGDVYSSTYQAFGVWIKAKGDGSTVPSVEHETLESVAGITVPAAASIPDDISQVSIHPDAEDGTAWYSVPEGAGNSGDASTVVALYTGDVDAWAGVHVEAVGGATAGFEAGKVTAKDNGVIPQNGSIEDMYANCFVASKGGVVTGALDSVESGVCGINVYVKDDGIATVNTGEIKAGEIGVRVINGGQTSETRGGKTWTDVAGNITSTMEGVYLNLTGKDAVSFAFVDGNLESSKGNGIEIVNYGGSAFVAVSGDAVSTAESSDDVKRAGLLYHGEGEAQVLVIGTLSGDYGVCLTDATQAEDLDLTAWAIKADNYDKIISGDDKDGCFAKSVSYIVMTEQPVAGGTLTACKKNGYPLDRKYGDTEETGFEVAHEDDLVLLMVEPDKGYKVVAAYNGMEDRVKIERAEDGNYYLKV
ncbi:MAG: hypothetical protein IKY03_00755, partial [Clostridia bacterium]|nr:hypothetical protein [Clostridia bacterium]